MKLATLFAVRPGLANLQSLCLEFPRYDVRHSLGDRSYQIRLIELLASVVDEIKEAIGKSTTTSSGLVKLTL
jgi:hypothetical protein